MKIYNTYTRKKEAFAPIEPKKVNMYVCGPTVYDYIHIGNARPVIFFDVVRRYFSFENDVDYVSNITDVDDKIINKARAEGVSETDISEHYLAQYVADCEALHVQPLRSMPKVTDKISEIIVFIEGLVRDGFAYDVAGDVYFRVRKATDYGKLSGKKIEDLIAGARVESNLKKEDPLDFTLWKKTTTGVTWESPWGLGRPGWHTECVVMIEDAFKGKIDIHGGGADLQFPHHENEIAQSICGAGHPIANYWMHVGRLSIDEEKMSKSIGNVIWVKTLLEEWDANAFRLFMLSTHYRQPINFSYEVLEMANKEWLKIKKTCDAMMRKLSLNESIGHSMPVDGRADAFDSLSEIEDKLSDFHEAMADDFNTPNALTALYALVKLVNKLQREDTQHAALRTASNGFRRIFDTLGFRYEFSDLTEADIALYKAWEQAREEKHFALADELRSRLQERELI
ncbi:MAG: cysteine--tRNA ligase [Defluviitaleaceae bacterium]|nr:cysteine--tRNA ligase [Defluviitaleaceae bacterium]